MSGFSSRRKPKKMIGLNRVKDFLLLIIIMKSSEILTNFVDKRRHNLFSELENGKITRTPSLFLPSSIYFFFFDNVLPLLFPGGPPGSSPIISEPLDATATKITHIGLS